MGIKRKREYWLKIRHRHIFPLLLAASTRIDSLTPRRLIIECLNMHLNYVQACHRNPGSSSTVQILPTSLLALLPLLLHTRYTRVASLSCEMVGAISLCSYEANVKLASDIQLLNALSFMFSRKHYAVVAACNAIMDLATTSVGLAKLEESCALEKLL